MLDDAAHPVKLNDISHANLQLPHITDLASALLPDLCNQLGLGGSKNSRLVVPSKTALCSTEWTPVVTPQSHFYSK